jgi:NTP pyrophosphatase (non-canonical NTP hydrolase)
MEFEKLRLEIGKKYLDTDLKSGPFFLLAVLFEEVGELAEAVRKGELENIREELVDVLFMVLSLSNIFEVDLEKRIVEKYIEGDPRSRWDLP